MPAPLAAVPPTAGCRPSEIANVQGGATTPQGRAGAGAALVCYLRRFTAGIISAGWTCSARASRSTASMRTERCPRSMRLMCVRCSPASSASASLRQSPRFAQPAHLLPELSREPAGTLSWPRSQAADNAATDNAQHCCVAFDTRRGSKAGGAQPREGLPTTGDGGHRVRRTLATRRGMPRARAYTHAYTGEDRHPPFPQPMPAVRCDLLS